MSSTNQPPPGGSERWDEHNAPTAKGGPERLSDRAEPETHASPPVIHSTPAEPPTMPELKPDGGPVEAIEVWGYQIIRELARGGMGIIYLARQKSLDRLVALKCLPASFREDPDRLERFQLEAMAAAKLTKHGIVPVYDVLEAAGTPVLVMPYIEGSDLAHILADRSAVKKEQTPTQGRHPWASLTEAEFLERVLGLLDRIIDALTLLHRSDVLHRDIKPPNILVDTHGDGWLTDFGLARFGRNAGEGWAGTVGTPGYMSPEQWDGNEDIDGRADVFSLGVTIYQSLTLELPYGRKRVSQATPAPRRPSQRNGLVPPALDMVLGKALHPDRTQRYQSAAELKEAWQDARRGPPAPVGWWRSASRWQRATAIAAVVCVLLLTGGVAGVLSHRASSGAGTISGGPEEPPPLQNAIVHVTTEPAGATVVFVPLHPDTGEPQGHIKYFAPPGQTTPLQIELAPGPYFVEAEVNRGTPNARFHQVYREVPRPGEGPRIDFAHWNWRPGKDGSIEWQVIKIPSADVTAKMARFEGSKTFIMGGEEPAEARPPHLQPVAPFFLDAREVTEAEYRDADKKKELPPHLQAALSRQGENFPVTNVTYNEALWCAEAMGKRLPTEAEYEFAATMGGKQKFPWGDDATLIKGWPLLVAGEPDWDHTPTEPPVFGLYSNVAEWTTTWHMHYPTTLPVAFPEDYRNTRTVRGGPYSMVVGKKPDQKESLFGPRYRYGVTTSFAWPGLGFRCARSVQPLFLHPGGP